MKSHLAAVWIFGMAVCVAVPVSGQAITTGDVLSAWDLMTNMVVDAAKAMPPEHYGYSPGEPLRTFADQINHTTASNIGFAGSVNAGQPSFDVPDRENPPQTKEEVVALLENSFAFFRGGLASLSDDDLAATVPWGRRDNQRMISRLKAILIVTSHLQREHGKTIMYLRGVGITPPPSGSWTF